MSLKFLLDTNVLSEPFSAAPSASVMVNLQKHANTCAISALTWHELRYGRALLPESRRKDALTSYLADVVLTSFDILDFDRRAADWLASERARLRKLGKVPAFVDAQIAATAVTRGLVLVTRNVDDFNFFDDLVVENWFEPQG